MLFGPSPHLAASQFTFGASREAVSNVFGWPSQGHTPLRLPLWSFWVIPAHPFPAWCLFLFLRTQPLRDPNLWTDQPEVRGMFVLLLGGSHSIHFCPHPGSPRPKLKVVGGRQKERVNIWLAHLGSQIHTWKEGHETVQQDLQPWVGAALQKHIVMLFPRGKCS